MMRSIRNLRREYDRHWLLAVTLYLSSYIAGAYIVSGLDHHGAWEWVGWTCFAVAMVLVTVVTARLRKADKR